MSTCHSESRCLRKFYEVAYYESCAPTGVYLIRMQFMKAELFLKQLLKCLST